MPKPKSQSWLRCPLTNILGSAANVRVLRELFRHGGELSVTSLAERTSMTVQGVRVVLNGLVDQHVVDVKGSGFTRLFIVRRDHPLSPALDELFRAEEGRFDAAMEALRRAADQLRKSTVAVWLYGSVARGEDVVGSDVDIAVVAKGDPEQAASEIRERLKAAEDDLAFTASVVGLDQADVLRLSAGDSWWTEIVRDAITIAGDDPKKLATRLRGEGGATGRRKLKHDDPHRAVQSHRQGVRKRSSR